MIFGKSLLELISADLVPTIAELAGYSIDPPCVDSHIDTSLFRS